VIPFGDPRFAPRRSDVPYLRRRSRPRHSQAAQPAAAQPGDARSAVAEFIAGRATRPGHAASSTDPAPLVTDFLTRRGPRRQPAAQPPPADAPAALPATPVPAPTSSLDLDEPVSRTPVHAPAPPASSSLDLDAPQAPPSAPPPAANPSLDLGGGASLDLDGSAGAPSAPIVAAAEPARRTRSDVRVRAGSRTILTVTEPTVTLTRVQSGLGALRFEAAWSAEVGDLRLGCAYQLRSGRSSTVQLTGGSRLAPPKSRRPVIVASHDRYEQLAVDLRQCRELARLIVYAFSESRADLRWGGTLITTTFGGARIELPLDTLQGGDVAVLMSMYNVHGEFVLRAEMQTLYGGVREAARAYGYERITWLDDRTTVD
jgi:uncharacterized protein involved in tellurium resistance